MGHCASTGFRFPRWTRGSYPSSKTAFFISAKEPFCIADTFSSSLRFCSVAIRPIAIGENSWTATPIAWSKLGMGDVISSHVIKARGA